METLAVFSLSFVEGPLDDDGVPVMRGQIRIGDHEEDFLASLYTWSVADYQQQWHAAATALVDGAPVAAFLTSFPSHEAIFHEVWPAWREGDRIFFQSRFLFADATRGYLNPGDLPVLMGRRETTDKDGPIPTWEGQLSWLQAFIADNSGD